MDIILDTSDPFDEPSCGLIVGEVGNEIFDTSDALLARQVIPRLESMDMCSCSGFHELA